MSANWKALITATVVDRFYWAECEYLVQSGSEIDKERIRSQTLRLMSNVSGLGFERMKEVSQGDDVTPEEEYMLTVAACTYTPAVVCEHWGVSADLINWRGDDRVEGYFIGSALINSFKQRELTYVSKA